MNEVISKPWGWEFTLLETPSVLVSYLHIAEGFSTSLHCHPRKRTGYVVLQGIVEVEFLSNTRMLGCGDRVNFRPGLFHRTCAINEDCIILEFESPPNKQDLLRMEDSSGRMGSEYESKHAIISEDLYGKYETYSKKLDSNWAGEATVEISNLSLCRKRVKILELLNSENPDTIVCLLDGAIYANEKYPSKEPGVIVNSGDVTSLEVLRRMQGILLLDGEHDFMIIKKI